MDTVDQTTTEQGKYEELRYLTDVYVQTQKLRIANANRVQASDEERDSNAPEPFVVGLVEKFEDLEKDIFRRMKLVVRDHPAWPWLDGVRGMGPTLSTKILGLIGDIENFDTVSKLWSFSGFGLYDGQIQKPVKGEKLTYNRRLKTAVYLAGESFIKSRSPYRTIYDASKNRYHSVKQVRPLVEQGLLGNGVSSMPDRSTPEGKKEWDRLIKLGNKGADSGARDGNVWTDLHVHNAARRKMVKLFLSHLWVVWREAEGLPTREPYAIEYLEHQTYIDPWEFSK